MEIKLYEYINKTFDIDFFELISVFSPTNRAQQLNNYIT